MSKFGEIPHRVRLNQIFHIPHSVRQNHKNLTLIFNFPHGVRLNQRFHILIFNFFKNIIVFLALLPVYFYRLVIRPLLPQSCKFFPTCSQYAIISIKRFGAFKGWWMASKRILRCQPFSKSSGYDPVPYHLKGGVKWIV